MHGALRHVASLDERLQEELEHVRGVERDPVGAEVPDAAISTGKRPANSNSKRNPTRKRNP